MLSQSFYDRERAKPMWQELEAIGVQPLESPEQVEQALARAGGTTLVVINSICGCAAGTARPGVALALQNELIPDHLATVFAGVDRDATARVRKAMPETPSSSPSVALFSGGKLAFFLPRQEIEGYTKEQVAGKLILAFNEHCSRTGPSVPPEQMKKAF